MDTKHVHPHHACGVEGWHDRRFDSLGPPLGGRKTVIITATPVVSLWCHHVLDRAALYASTNSNTHAPRVEPTSKQLILILFLAREPELDFDTSCSVACYKTHNGPSILTKCAPHIVPISRPTPISITISGPFDNRRRRHRQ